MPALSGTAAGAERAQIRPPRVKEGGSDTAKRCFRGPHELAFIPSKIFIYPQFASSGGVRLSTALMLESREESEISSWCVQSLEILRQRWRF